MSLFLSESASFTAVAQVPYDQAMLGLMENISDLATLTEASLHADFTLRQQAVSGVLTEAESDNAKAGFFARLGAHIKSMYLKAKQRLLEFWESLKARVKGLWNRLTAKFGNDELQIPKSAVKALDSVTSGLEKLGNLVGADIEKADYKTNFVTAAEAFDASFKKLDEVIAAEQKAKQLVGVKASALTAARDFADKAAAQAGKQLASLATLQKEHEQATAEVAKARAKGDAKDAKAAAAGKAVGAGESVAARTAADEVAKQKSSSLTAAITVANRFASAAATTAATVTSLTAKAHAAGRSVTA